MIRIFSLISCFFLTTPVQALEGKDVFLLVNKNVPASKEVALHYCQKRGVPVDQIITLDLPKTEDISRKEYNEKLVTPLREALKDKRAKVLLSCYGVPLRVGGQDTTDEEKAEIKKLDPLIKQLQAEIATLQAEIAVRERYRKTWPHIGDPKETAAKKEDLGKKQQELRGPNQQRAALSHAESQACVDSELMLLWWDDYALRRWQVNLLYFQIPEESRKGKKPMVMTCRLDGPTPEIAKGLVDQAMEVEKKGLEGKVYVDARGIRFNPKNEDGFGYGGYDESMREMAAMFEKEGKMTVVLDDKGELFKPGECTDCALYCGWYSHANFIDCCRFTPGAIAWHLASSEAVSLRRSDVKFWCKNLLEKGAAATLGPVAEPYTIGFPKPAEFFGFLGTGTYTLVEAYSRSLMLCSWMGVLVGDPLYNPFAKNPRFKEELVVPSPKGTKFVFN